MYTTSDVQLRFVELMTETHNDCSTTESLRPGTANNHLFDGCLVKQQMFMERFGNHPTETTTKTWFFQVAVGFCVCHLKV